MKTDYRFYYIPRTDMDSMTPGRMMAQATHAAQQFANNFGNYNSGFAYMFERMRDRENNKIFNREESVIDDLVSHDKYCQSNTGNHYSLWTKETKYGFGTTIVLKPKTTKNQVEEFDKIFNYFSDIENVKCELVIDPEYFIKDGHTTHIIKDVTTGIYIFCTKEDLDKFDHYELFDRGFEK